MSYAPHVPLGQPARNLLADSLGDLPETVIAIHQLRHGLAHAYLAGDLPGTPDFRAAVIQHIVDPSEPTAYGTDAEAIWSLLRSLPGWTCVEIDPAVASPLESLILAERDGSVRRLEDVYLVATSPIVAIDHPDVRLLAPADLDLLIRARQDFGGIDWSFGSPENLLAEGFAAGAIVDDQLVAIAHTGAISTNHADIGVATLAAYRRRGYSKAAASLLGRAIQSTGRTPVWSCGATNAASLATAHRLGFAEVSRRLYLIPE